MGELANRFGGKIDGELIRAVDWNGLIDGIEGQLVALDARIDARLDALEPRVAAVEAQLAAIAQRFAPLEALSAVLQARQRRIDLSSTKTHFAVGERAEIVARVTDLFGAPLNLANAATRPWIDFMTVWGSLKAAPGFASVAGTGGRTVTVQVNASGEAKVLLRAEAGAEFAEEQEDNIAAVLATKVGAKSVSQIFLDAPTPGSSELAPAYAQVTKAYRQPETSVMRDYLDINYLAKPSRSFSRTTLDVLSWRDEHATVVAFVKPDDNPGTSDGAMAAGSIRVTFRDWVYPWVVTDFLPVKPDLVNTYTTQFIPHIGIGYEAAVNGIFNTIETRTQNVGLLGTYREMAAAQEAIDGLTIQNPPKYMTGVRQAVIGGLAVERGLIAGQAIAPLVAEDVAPARAVARGAIGGDLAADAAMQTLRRETSGQLREAETRIVDSVKAENVRFENHLLRSDGPVFTAQTLATTIRRDVEGLKFDVRNKVGMEVVGQLMNVRAQG